MHAAADSAAASLTEGPTEVSTEPDFIVIGDGSDAPLGDLPTSPATVFLRFFLRV